MFPSDPRSAPNRVQIGDGLHFSFGDTVIKDSNGVHMAIESLDGWEEMPAINTSDGGVQTFGERNLLMTVVIAGPSEAALIQKFKEINAAVPLRNFSNIGTPPPAFSVWYDGECRGHVRVTLPEPHKLPIQGRKTGSGRITRTTLHFVARKPAKLSGDGSGPTKIFSSDWNGNVSILNEGNGPTPPMVLEVRRSLGPVITIPGTDQIMSFPGLVVRDSPLVIDLEKMTATYEDQSVISEMDGSFLRPNRDLTTFTLSDDSWNPNGDLTVKTYDTEL